jgi:hypothetical protein
VAGFFFAGIVRAEVGHTCARPAGRSTISVDPDRTFRNRQFVAPHDGCGSIRRAASGFRHGGGGQPRPIGHINKD